MQGLLRWGIENSTTGDDPNTVVPLTRRTDLDPGIIDVILGKPDSELMKTALANAQDSSLDEDARSMALDDLEMLVENIDNANDLEKLKMWEPLQDLLSSPSDNMKTQALWVIGTALQNNPAAQNAYFAHEPLPTVLSFLSPSTRSSRQLRSKAIYALSGLLKHNAAAIAPFEAAGGWHTLRGALSDSDISVRRKTAFLLNTLLIPAITTVAGASDGPANVHPNSHALMVADPSSADTAPATLRAMREHGLLSTLVRELTVPTHGGYDTDLEEKLMRSLYTYVSAHNGRFEGVEKKSLRAFLDSRRAVRQGESDGDLGLDANELEAFENALA
ncbi:armadillo-type protein [Multifurca ochricompacta]|uniref:Armadillo-type protein n=1 Tax=Multifurca ochricompacta TaxID=376703 RepID=A0AAD4LX19_9AGAM|nr:armadillo-type protein [Multifurca ochricompacta]